MANRTPTPSTPPFLNLASPDLKNFKAFLRSPNRPDQPSTLSSSNQQLSTTNEDQIFGQISELDFESAYALLTKSPAPINNISTPPLSSFTANLNQSNTQLHQDFNAPLFHQFTQLQSPKSAFFPLDNNDFKSMLYNQTNSPSPKVMSPIIDLESLAYFNNPSPGQSEILGHPIIDSQSNELLSANETNALEQFLDSIIDDKIKDKTSEENQQNLPPITEDENSKHMTGLGVLASEEQHVLGTPLSLSSSIDLDKDQILNKEDFTITKRRERKKRKLLSEEEKKFNHTSSEQRRRGMIKDAFDDLVKLLPLNKDPSSKRKNQSKSVILEKTASEIEKIENINNELRKMLKNESNID